VNTNQHQGISYSAEEHTMNPDTIDPGEVRFFCGNSHRQLAEDIASYLGVPLENTFNSVLAYDHAEYTLCNHFLLQ
jgi:hypothetical protein